jgi:hypothetical protein
MRKRRHFGAERATFTAERQVEIQTREESFDLAIWAIARLKYSVVGALRPPVATRSGRSVTARPERPVLDAVAARRRQADAPPA